MRHLLLAFYLTINLSVAETFRPGDQWIAIGDSVTFGGAYTHNIELFYLTRHPAATLTYTKAGIAGDTASGVLRRFDWDIAAAHPSVATVMLGMNDVGRCDYLDGPDDLDTATKRHTSIAVFDKSLRKVITRLHGLSTRVIVLSPTPYDDTARLTAPVLPGCNDALADLGRRARAIAAETGSDFIDLHTPLTTLNRSHQVKDPTFTLIGGDRVHPGPPGYLATAFYFLQSQGVCGTVAIAHLDAATASIRRAEQCAITEFTATPQTVNFTYSADALPFPIPADATAALEWIPFQTELNREELRVRGLCPGSYKLKIDNQETATLDATDLARGVNLAELPTPQLAQAKGVLETLQKRWILMGQLRIIASIENELGRDLPRPVTLETIDPALAVWEAKLAADPNHWQRKQPAEYRTWKPNEAAIRVFRHWAPRQLAFCRVRIPRRRQFLGCLRRLRRLRGR